MGGLVQHQKIDNDAQWLRQLRLDGRTAFEQQGVPSAKTEAWKYTKPRELNADDFILSSEITAQNSVELPYECYPFYFNNGIFDGRLPELPEGVEAVKLTQALAEDFIKDYLGKLVETERQPFAALNQYYLSSGLCIHILPYVKLDKPLLFVNHTAAGESNLFFNIRNLLVMEEGASAELIEYYHYSGAVKSRYLANIVNEFFLSPASKLYHYKLQKEAFKANHIALNAASVSRNAIYKSFTLQQGANIARNETRVLLTEEQAQAEVNAAYMMNGWAAIDTTTDIEHLAPCTFSEQLVKGVVGGDAKGIFQGKIHIAPHAVKTEGRQLHKALLLSDTAEIDAKPELEIFADDVKCSHGAASGELDEEQLFYMQSRGISREEAKQILIDAYLNDVFAKIENSQIQDWFKGQK